MISAGLPWEHQPRARTENNPCCWKCEKEPDFQSACVLPAPVPVCWLLESLPPSQELNIGNRYRYINFSFNFLIYSPSILTWFCRELLQMYRGVIAIFQLKKCVIFKSLRIFRKIKYFLFLFYPIMTFFVKCVNNTQSMIFMFGKKF